MSNLSFVSSIIEKVIFSTLQPCIHQFNPFQSAYRPGHSTQTALLKFLNDLHSLDHGMYQLWSFLTCQLLLTQQTIPFYSNVLNMFLAYTILLYTGFLLTSQTELRLLQSTPAHVALPQHPSSMESNRDLFWALIVRLKVYIYNLFLVQWPWTIASQSWQNALICTFICN